MASVPRSTLRPPGPPPRPLGRAVVTATVDATMPAWAIQSGRVVFAWTVTRYRVIGQDATPERTVRSWSPDAGAYLLGAPLGVLPVGTRIGYRDARVTGGTAKPEGYRPLDWRDRGGFRVWGDKPNTRKIPGIVAPTYRVDGFGRKGGFILGD